MSTTAQGRYQTVPEDTSARLGLVHIDQELCITGANSAFRENFACGSSTAVGAPLSAFFHEANRDSLRDHLSELRGDGGQANFSIPLTMVSGNGEAIDCLVTCASLISGVHLQCTGCTTAAAIFRDTVTGTPMRLFPAPLALTEIPGHIIEGLASGLSTQQLASRLGLSSRGVEYHISSMLRVLKAPNRSALVARAYALGILSPHYWPPRIRSPYLADVTGPLFTDDASTGEGHAAPSPAETVDTPAPLPIAPLGGPHPTSGAAGEQDEHGTVGPGGALA